MRTVKVHEAKTKLSQLLAAVEGGEEIIIARGAKPVAKLVAATGQTARPRVLGQFAGQFPTDGTFDEPLPDDILDSIEAPLA